VFHQRPWQEQEKDETWKRSFLRERDLTDFVSMDI
jgi:hypothetical protein